MIVVNKISISFFQLFLRIKIRAIAFYPFIFMADEKDRNNIKLINHEKIHLRQQVEMLIIPFYIWYLIEFFSRGYWNVSFEKEAYANEKDLQYLKKEKFLISQNI